MSAIIYNIHQLLLRWLTFRMRWAGQAVRMSELRIAYKILTGKPEERDHSVDLGVDGIIIK